MKRPEDTEMNKSDLLRTLKSFFLEKLPKALLFYILAPLLCIVFLSKPIGEAACRSETAAFLILLAALAAVILNWLVYTARRRKRPSTLVFSYGVLCLLIAAYMEHEAVPADSALSATLAIICGSLMMIFFLVLSHWFASRRHSKAALAIAVGLRIAFGVVLFFMACQVFRDFETRCVSRETWITVAILIVLLLAAAAPRLLTLIRRSFLRRRATAQTEGTITRIIGETHLDLDDDPVTLFHCTIQYTVSDHSYETQASVTRHFLRRYGKENFIGRKIPVFYDPSDPAKAFMNRIDRHVLDQKEEEREQANGTAPA